MITITCSLFRPDRSAHVGYAAGVYTPRHVDRLYRGCQRFLSEQCELVCITDHDPSAFEEPVHAVPFAHADHVGTWMSLTEVFRPDLELGRALFMGLDTIICGSLDPIAAYDGPMGMVWSPLNVICNAIVSYTGDSGAHLWNNYVVDPAGVCERSQAPWSAGSASEMIYWRQENEHKIDLLNEGNAWIQSYAREWVPRPHLREQARVVYFHGRRKPWNMTEAGSDELTKHWEWGEF